MFSLCLSILYCVLSQVLLLLLFPLTLFSLHSSLPSLLLCSLLSPLLFPSLLSHHQVFDAFCPRLTDRNSKVNLHALEAFSNMVPLLCNTLVPVTNNIVVALVPNLASRNATIHSAAMTVLDLISQCIGKSDTKLVCILELLMLFFFTLL